MSLVSNLPVIFRLSHHFQEPSGKRVQFLACLLASAFWVGLLPMLSALRDQESVFHRKGPMPRKTRQVLWWGYREPCERMGGDPCAPGSQDSKMCWEIFHFVGVSQV